MNHLEAPNPGYIGPVTEGQELVPHQAALGGDIAPQQEQGPQSRQGPVRVIENAPNTQAREPIRRINVEPGQLLSALSKVYLEATPVREAQGLPSLQAVGSRAGTPPEIGGGIDGGMDDPTSFPTASIDGGGGGYEDPDRDTTEFFADADDTAELGEPEDAPPRGIGSQLKGLIGAKRQLKAADRKKQQEDARAIMGSTGKVSKIRTPARRAKTSAGDIRKYTTGEMSAEELLTRRKTRKADFATKTPRILKEKGKTRARVARIAKPLVRKATPSRYSARGRAAREEAEARALEDLDE